MKKLALLATIILFVGIIGVMATFRQVWSSQAAKQVVDEKVITQSFKKVNLDSGNALIYFQPAAENETKTKVELSGEQAKSQNYTFSAKVKGDTLDIVLNNDRQFQFFSFHNFNTALTLTVYLPKKQYDSMKLKNNNGKMHIEQLNVKDLTADTHNGKIEMKHTISKSVNVETNNGEITLDYVEGNIRGKANNGKVSVFTKNLDRSIQLHCDNGVIDVQSDKEPTNTTFNVHVDHGQVNILNKYKENAVIGKGENIIDLSTNNGKITVSH